MTNRNTTFHILLAAQFALIAVSMLVNVKTGLFSMVLILLLTTVCLIQLSNGKSTEWKRGQNIMTWLFIVWLLYYIMEIMNPNCVLEAWNINITPYALIPLICAFVVPVVIRTRKDIELLLLVWSVFVIIFTLKGYWQKNHGFSTKDLYFLHVLGGARTHIIWSGIRYFSCFSDAANYGVHSAMAAVTFSISAFFVDSRWKRLYFLFIALCGIYGMGISGTRSAMGVLMGGMLMITIIAKNWKALLGGIFISIGIFVFFYYTNIGSGNQYIHKMRSSFHRRRLLPRACRKPPEDEGADGKETDRLWNRAGQSGKLRFERTNALSTRLVADCRLGGNRNCRADTLSCHTRHSLRLVFMAPDVQSTQ